MENITYTARLKNAIQLLEVEQAYKWQLVKEQFLLSIVILKPINILKSTLKDIVSSPHLPENILNTAVGLATGFISKKIFIGSSVNIIRKLIGSVLQLGVTNAATQNSEFITSLGQFAFQKIFRKK